MRVLWILCILIFGIHGFAKEKVVILPYMPNKNHVLENPKHPNPSIAVFGQVKQKLEGMGFEVLITELSSKSPILRDASVKYFVWQNPLPHRFPLFLDIPKDKLMLWLWEPKTVLPAAYNPKMHQRFQRVYTWDDSLVDEDKYFKFNYPHLHPMQESLIPFSERKFCCLINANKRAKRGFAPWKDYYAARRKILQFFADLQSDELDLFGKGWGRHPLNRGPVPNKFKALSQYRFCVCYENTNTPGSVTEQIMDCFRAGVIPVYLGAENITEIIPEDCYINRRRFDSDRDLYDHLRSIDETTFDRYIENIRSYLSSDRAQMFSQEAFVKIFIDSIVR